MPLNEPLKTRSARWWTRLAFSHQASKEQTIRNHISMEVGQRWVLKLDGGDDAVFLGATLLVK